jgi:hypothetical protein
MRKKSQSLFDDDLHFESEVRVNWGKLLEDNLKKWQGGSQHIRGIGEYITNADDSYRRLKKFSDQEIFVDIYSDRKKGRKIDKLVIRDNAEGMSKNDLENKFFVYFESHSGRVQGQNVTGQFGTGGKAYAIMNFKECYITSVKNGKKNKAWFKWDGKQKKIVKSYTEKGFVNEVTDEPNGTMIELFDTQNKINLVEFVFKLNQLPRIRHVVKSQKVLVTLHQGRLGPQTLQLEYEAPKKFAREWVFPLPDKLKNKNQKENEFRLLYFEKPLESESYIDLSDGISTVADLDIAKYDDRPYSKYLYGELSVRKLQNSAAVKENRKGLEEGNDLTMEIEEFIKDKVNSAINEIQDMHRQKEREKNIETTNEKIRELNKFLKKCDLNFNVEISNILKKSKEGKLSETNIPGTGETGEGFDHGDEGETVSGEWNAGDGDGGGGAGGESKFTPDEKGKESAVKAANKILSPHKPQNRKRGLIVLMTDDPHSPVSPDEYGVFEDPVIDRYLKSDGIILINANNPIIAKTRVSKQYQYIFNERVANYVLLVVAQYMATTELEMHPEGDKPDPMILFKQKFFKLQADLRQDKDIDFYEDRIE